MHRTLLFLLMMCIPAQAEPQDFLTQDDIDAFEAADKCTIDPERYGIREPKEEEILEYGSGIMIFEYYNSPNMCSETIEGMEIYHEDKRWGTLKVEVGGKNDSDERVWFFPEDVPYQTYRELPMVIPDHWEPHIIVLYPWVS